MNTVELVNEMIKTSFPIVIITSIIFITLHITYLITKKEHVYIYREVLCFTFIIYILCLFQVVTFQDTSSIGTNNFIPFREILRYKIFSYHFFKNIVGNVIMFIPYGFFISLFLKSKDIKVPFLLVFIASLSIETMQRYIGRVFDVDDILLNCLGGVLGYFIFYLLKKLYLKIPKKYTKEKYLNIYCYIVCIIILSTIIGVIR